MEIIITLSLIIKLLATFSFAIMGLSNYFNYVLPKYGNTLYSKIVFLCIFINIFLILNN